jgi:outer membrane immunogenic protein
MKRFVVAGLGVLGLAGLQPAAAADLPIRGPVPPIYEPAYAPAWNWTGVYMGFNGGYSSGSSNTALNLFDTSGSTVPLATVNDKFKLNGGLIGGQIGYNWQMGRFLVGFETDLQWAFEKGSTSLSCATAACLPAATLPAGAATTVGLTQTLDWFGTARVRLGGLVVPSVLLYVTGGFAYGDVKTDVAMNGFGTNGAIPPVGVPVGSNTTSYQLHAGWTAGAGIEFNIAGNWTGRVEYLYLDLGNFGGGATLATGTVPAFVSSYSSRITDNIVRAGFNYRFGPAPIYSAF